MSAPYPYPTAPVPQQQPHPGMAPYPGQPGAPPPGYPQSHYPPAQPPQQYQQQPYPQPSGGGLAYFGNSNPHQNPHVMGPGSLGTPKYPGRSPAHSQLAYGNRRTPKNSSNASQGNASEIVLAPTRPVLKAIARACRCPPWNVGKSGTAATLDDEIVAFQLFIQPSKEERTKLDEIFHSIAYKATDVWPSSSLSTCNALLLGAHVPGQVMECVILNSSDDADELTKFSQGLNEAGFTAETFKNSRGSTSLRLVEARGGERIYLHVGAAARSTLKMTEHIKKKLEENPSIGGAISAIDTVMKQSKHSEDGNPASGGMSTEVIAVMVVAMLSKYPTLPTAGTVLMDFFITYGYHFDCQTSAVGMVTSATKEASKDGSGWPEKPFPEAQLCVLDPAPAILKEAGETSDDAQAAAVNLAATVSKFPQVKSLFQYCWMTLNQWSTMAQESRAQSPLSTIIGGESFWSRVLLLALAGEEPYATVINEKKPSLRI